MEKQSREGGGGSPRGPPPPPALYWCACMCTCRMTRAQDKTEMVLHIKTSMYTYTHGQVEWDKLYLHLHELEYYPGLYQFYLYNHVKLFESLGGGGAMIIFCTYIVKLFQSYPRLCLCKYMYVYMEPHSELCCIYVCTMSIMYVCIIDSAAVLVHACLYR